ncbi:MAG: hypothetical protein MUC87_07925 [Bacteroidia bacterium]|nr:hypothetical protein [Bacteroidia bacterium]
MKKINLTLTIDEANLIFKALGRLPFNEVYELIGKLNEQANAQLTANGSQPAANGIQGFTTPQQ